MGLRVGLPEDERPRTTTQPRPKVLDYSIALDRRYRVSADGGSHEQLPRDFAPEHLVLAGLARCTLTSLAYHAGRAGIKISSSSAVAKGEVTKRASDGRYAFVDLECTLDVELQPAPDEATQRDLLARRSGTASWAPRSSPRRATSGG